MNTVRSGKLVRLPLVVLVAGVTLGQFAGCKMFDRGPTLPQRPMNDSLPHLESTPELEAAKVPEKMLSNDQKANMQLVMAASYEKADEPEKAIELYDKVVKNDPKRGAAFHRLAILYDKTGKQEQANGAYKTALKLDKKNADLHCDMGYSLYLQRRWAEAEDSFKQALTLRPDLARAHNNYGLLLARTGRTEDALWEFARAGCNEPEARANMAHAFMLEKQWGEARQQCELGLAIPSASPIARAKLDRLRNMIVRGNSEGAPQPLPAPAQG